MLQAVGSREYTLSEVLDYATEEPVSRVYDGFDVWMDSLRYRVFLQGQQCPVCGIKGTVFILQRDTRAQESNRAHFNLFARAEDGTLVLMTKDHIHPKSKGGKDTLSNLRTMCFPCNQMKGSTT